MTSLAKWFSVRLPTTWLWVRIPLQSLKFQILRLLWARSSLTFRKLQSAPSCSHLTAECRFTLKYICDMIRTHSLLVILSKFLSAFSCIHFMSNFSSRHSHLSRGHRISCPAHHLKQTDNKPFSGLIGPKHKAKSWVVSHQNWVAR